MMVDEYIGFIVFVSMLCMFEAFYNKKLKKKKS